MANYCAARDWEVTLLTYGDGSVADVYDVHPAVACWPLGNKARSANSIEAIVCNLKRLVVIRKAIKGTDPDAVISFLIG